MAVEEVTAGMVVVVDTVDVQEEVTEEEVEATEGNTENDKSRPNFASKVSIYCCVNFFGSLTRF